MFSLIRANSNELQQESWERLKLAPAQALPAQGQGSAQVPSTPWSVLIISVKDRNSSLVCVLALIELRGSSSQSERVLTNFQGSWPRKLYSTIKYWSSFISPNTHIHQVNIGMCRFMKTCRGGKNFKLTKLHSTSFTSRDQLFISVCHLCI